MNTMPQHSKRLLHYHLDLFEAFDAFVVSLSKLSPRQRRRRIQQNFTSCLICSLDMLTYSQANVPVPTLLTCRISTRLVLAHTYTGFLLRSSCHSLTLLFDRVVSIVVAVPYRRSEVETLYRQSSFEEMILMKTYWNVSKRALQISVLALVN